MTNQSEPTYMRRCQRCGQFMNWRVFPDGEAHCLVCGCKHDPLPSPTPEQLELYEKLMKKKPQYR